MEFSGDLLLIIFCLFTLGYGYLGYRRGRYVERKAQKKRYFKIKDGNVFASDVDDTLVMWADPKNFPGKEVTITTNGFPEVAAINEYALEHLKKMKRRGYSVVVWSAGGSDWAEAVVQALGIEEYVDVVSPKFTDHLDDVRDPVDKIGRWAYIDPHGNVQRAKLDGTVKSWKLKEGEDLHEKRYED